MGDITAPTERIHATLKTGVACSDQDRDVTQEPAAGEPSVLQRLARLGTKLQTSDASRMVGKLIYGGCDDVWISHAVADGLVARGRANLVKTRRLLSAELKNSTRVLQLVEQLHQQFPFDDLTFLRGIERLSATLFAEIRLIGSQAARRASSSGYRCGWGVVDEWMRRQISNPKSVLSCFARAYYA